MYTKTNKLLGNKLIFYFIFSLILVSNLVIFNLQSNEYESSYCEKFLVGVSDDFTLDEYIEHHGLEKTIRSYGHVRQDFYESLSTFDTFGRGWTRRNEETLEQSLKLV